MQKENNLTVGQWCDQWFTANRHKWNGNTEGGYRNLIYSHILPSIGSVALSDLTEQAVADFYNNLRSQGLGARSIWCVHLLLRRCLDEAAQSQLIPYNLVRLCQEPKQRNTKQPLCAWAAPALSERSGAARRSTPHLHRTIKRPAAM